MTNQPESARLLLHLIDHLNDEAAPSDAPIEAAAPRSDWSASTVADRVTARLRMEGLIEATPTPPEGTGDWLSDQSLIGVLARWTHDDLASISRDGRTGPQTFDVPLESERDFNDLVGRAKRPLEPWPHVSVELIDDAASGLHQGKSGESPGMTVAVGLLLPQTQHSELFAELTFEVLDREQMAIRIPIHVVSRIDLVELSGETRLSAAPKSSIRLMQLTISGPLSQAPSSRLDA